MHANRIMLFVTVLLISACAATQDPVPGNLAALPTVEFGDSPPVDGNYVLHFPAGKPIDTPVSFGGNLFTGEDRKLLRVTPKQDIYAYRNWVSFDRQSWFDGDTGLKMDLQLVLPGYQHPEPGYLNLRLDRKE